MTRRLACVGIALAVEAVVARAPEVPAWVVRAPLPQPVGGYMAGIVRGHLVVAGGSYWWNGRKEWTARVQRFDPSIDTWSEAAALPEPRSDAASVVVDDMLYVFGGVVSERARADALTFDGRRWIARPDARLPAPRVYATAVADGASIYLLGGLVTAGDYTTTTATFWRWHPSGGTWEVLPPVPGPGRINHAMAVVASRVYVLGGATSGSENVSNLDDIQVYDPAARTWRRAGKLPQGLRASWAVSIGGRVLLVGGYTDSFSPDLFVFEPGVGVRAAGRLPHALADAKFFRLGDRVLGAGGEAAPGIRGRWTFEGRLPDTWLR